MLFAVLLIAPVMDEIIGGFQFRAMCIPENLLIYDEKKVRGKTVTTKSPSTETVYKILPIWILTRKWFV